MMQPTDAPEQVNFNELVGSHDIVLITLDTLRYDVAQDCWAAGHLPNLAKRLPSTGWQKRHSPASFTFAAHQAFFAGFLPTPVQPGVYPRLFAANFLGSQSIDEATFCFDAPDLPSGLRQHGYHTICAGGVGFFNQLTPLGRVLPERFDQSHWCHEFSVVHPDSTAHQVDWVLAQTATRPRQPMMIFVNVSALHQPNCYYVQGAVEDSPRTQAAALRYVDGQLGRLFDKLAERGPGFCILCSDHGTAYGEDGYRGHRIAHEVVWNVPYAEFAYGQPA